MVEFHGNIVSAKRTETLVGDMHWNAKKLMYQASVSRHLVIKIKQALRKLMNKKTKADEKEKIKKELVVWLKELEKFSIWEEKEQFLVGREAAEVQKRTLNHMKLHVRVEIKKLLGLRSLPGSYGNAIIKKVGGYIQDERKDIGKQAQIALMVKRGSISVTLRTLSIISPSEVAAARKGKRVTLKAKKELHIIKIAEDKLKKDEQAHDIDRIKQDLISEAHDDEKEIHYVYTNLLYCLLFMSYIEKRFETLEDVMKKGKRHSDVSQFINELENKIKKIKAGWDWYMTGIVKVLQQLRFSVAPAEEGKILKQP